MMDRALAPSDRRQDIIHPSEMAKADWCPRATYFRIKTGHIPQKKYNFVLENIFDEGHATHRKWQNRLADMGLIWGYWSHNGDKVGPCLRPDDGLHWEYEEFGLVCEDLMIHGSTDGVIPELQAMIEVKTIGSGTLRFEAPKLMEKHSNDAEKVWKDLHRPLGSHIKQGNLYLWLARQMGVDVYRMIFIYEFKANQQVKEFVIELSMDVVQPLLDKAQSIVYALEGKSGLPPCPFDGCLQCQEYDGEGTQEERGGEQPHAGDGPVEPRGAQEGGSTGSARSTSAVRRAAEPTGRPDRSGRQQADESVSGPDGVGELARGANVPRTGRRKIRRRAPKED